MTATASRFADHRCAAAWARRICAAVPLEQKAQLCRMVRGTRLEGLVARHVFAAAKAQEFGAKNRN